MNYRTPPANKRPMLPSLGIPNSGPNGYGWTPHRFVKVVTRDDPSYGNLRPEYAHLFVCTATGAERLCGLQGMPTPEIVEADAKDEAAHA